jgi:hypothetical protein
MVGYVRVRMALAVVRSNSLLLRGSRKRRSSRPFIDEGAAMENWNVWRERYYRSPSGHSCTHPLAVNLRLLLTALS